MMRESSVVTPVLKWWRDFGYIALKLSDQSTAGQPDWLFLGPDRFVAMIEFKKPGATPSPLQQKWIDDLTALGHRVSWFDNTALAIQWLRGELDLHLA